MPVHPCPRPPHADAPARTASPRRTLACLVAWILVPFAGLPGEARGQAQDSARGGLSLAPERTVSFETSEGTYMNLDVSPDGRTIVFDLLGDIYTVPAGGGRATRLTSGMAYDFHPVYSPDGSRIAYVSDASGSDNLWSMAADGSDAKAITKERERAVGVFEWTPDGEYLLAKRAGDLWLYHRDGGAGMEVSKDAQANGAFGPVFSPDGRFLYFSARAGSPYGAENSLANVVGWQVRRLDRVTGDIAQITAVPNGAFRPRISPDGKWLAYGARLDAVTGLRLRSLETDEDVWLLPRMDRDQAERAGTLDLMPRYDFTPDGAAVIVATGGTFQRIDIASKQATRIAFTAQVEQQLAGFTYFESRIPGPADVRVHNIRYANRSPDGRRLAFAALGRVWLQDLPAGAPRAIAEQPAGQFQPVLSPDGRSLAWVTWNDTAGGHVWTMPVSGGRPERLTRHAGFYIHPAWSPDGSKVAYIREDPAAFRNIWSRNTGRIFWVETAAPAGGAPREERYVTSAPSDNRLTFSADGTRITYVSEVRPAAGGGEGAPSLTSKLSSVRLDGTDRRVVADIAAEAYEAIPSPDGRFVAFAVREDIYIAALPLTPEPPSIGETRGPGPVKRVTREGGIDIHWEDAGRTLAWTFADTYYRIDAEQALSAPAPAPAAGAARTVAPDSAVVRLSAPRHVPRGTVVLTGADVITMRGDEVLRNAAVVITDNRIVEVGPASQVRVPQGSRVIDVAGRTIMPGLVDVHAHLRPPRDVFVQAAWPYLANLAFGVTTTRDVSSSNDGFAYHEMVETGQILGPRIYSTGRAMTTSNAKIESLEDARSLVRHYQRMGTNVIKQYMQPHRRQRQWVIQAARELGMNATNEGGGDLRLDLTMVLDGYGGFEHALPQADLYGDVIRLIAESKTWYTPTLVVAYGGPTAEWYFYQTTNVHDDERLNRFTPHEIVDRRTRRGEMAPEEEYHFLAVARGAAAVLKAGGNIGLGAHGEEQGICAHWELWGLQLGGLSNHEALRVATIMSAEALGFQQDVGSIEAGKLADLLILDASPLESIRNSTSIRWVMKNGELFEGATLRQVWPVEKDAPPFLYTDFTRNGKD